MRAWLDPRSWSRRRRALIGALVVLVAVLARPVDRHLRAASLLLRFADAGARGLVAGYGRHAITENLHEVPTARGPVRARLYRPIGAPDAPGVVLVHGVHRLSIDEPRLMRLARALATSGVVVLTPEVREIADYRIDPASIETIGAAARHLRRQLERPVGLIGTSFAGGLALLAASDPRFAADVGVVLAVGAQHDMRRVMQFFRTNEVLWPDGHRQPLGAHPYGALVLVYGQLDRLMPPD
ncbi:MAG: alpha/beta hydrolase, partial [Myxococcales bacterium]